MTGRYETIIVGAPTLTEEENGGIVASLEGTITEGKGTLIRTEPWGKRKLAYKIQKFDEGYYTLLFYESDAKVVHELERRIRMNERLLRFLTVKVDWEEKVARAAAHKALRRGPGAAAEGQMGESVDGDIADLDEGGRG